MNRDRSDPPARRRIAATACWRFPIYSQTFVYQELTQLIHGGYDLTFLFAEPEGDDQLSPQFLPLWDARRQMALKDAAHDADYAYFETRMPERVAALTRLLSESSGMDAARLRTHIHFRQGFSFARIIESQAPDYLHSYFFYEGTLFSFMASYLLGIPRGVSCYADHALADYDLKVVPLHLQQCSLVVATSSRIKRELLQLAPSVDPARIVVKPNAINTEHFPFVERREPAPGEPHRLVCVSRYDPKKGLIFLVRALSILRERGLNVEAHHVGGVDLDQHISSNCARQIEAEIRRHRLERYLHLEGRCSEAQVNAMLARAHLFVAPFIELPTGDKDGVPTTLLEAMSAGLPVVATDAGSIAEVIRPDHDGVIVPQRDARALADAIAELIARPERRHALAARAAATVRERFDVAVCERIFHDAIAALPSPGPSCPV